MGKKDFDDPDVITAYINYCRDMIKRFKPDYMAYWIEVHYVATKKPSQWPGFLKFAKEVYTTLKAENPSLPIFVSFSMDQFWQDERNQKPLPVNRC